MPFTDSLLALITSTFRTKGTPAHTQYGPTRAAETRTVLQKLAAPGVELTYAELQDALGTLRIGVVYRIKSRGAGLPDVLAEALTSASLASQEAYTVPAGADLPLTPCSYDVGTNTTTERAVPEPTEPVLVVANAVRGGHHQVAGTGQDYAEDTENDLFVINMLATFSDALGPGIPATFRLVAGGSGHSAGWASADANETVRVPADWLIIPDARTQNSYLNKLSDATEVVTGNAYSEVVEGAEYLFRALQYQAGPYENFVTPTLVDSVYWKRISPGGTASSTGPANTDGLAEGATNKYFTAARAVAAQLAGYAKAGVARALAAGDSVLVAFGIVEKRLDDVSTALASKADLVAGKIPAAQLPDSLLGQVKYKGTYLFGANQITSPDAALNGQGLPVAASGNAGWYFLVQDSGVLNSKVYNTGDWLISNGAAGWDKVDNTDAVQSVHGRTGAVVAAVGDYTTDHITEGTAKFWTNARTLASTLTGFVVGSNLAVAATDTILVAIGKLQRQINELLALLNKTTRQGDFKAGQISFDWQANAGEGSLVYQTAQWSNVSTFQLTNITDSVGMFNGAPGTFAGSGAGGRTTVAGKTYRLTIVPTDSAQPSSIAITT